MKDGSNCDLRRHRGWLGVVTRPPILRLLGKRLRLVSLVALAVFIVATPVSAHVFVEWDSVDGANCDWTGQLQREGVFNRTIGTTTQTNGDCDAQRVRVNYSNGGAPITTAYTTEFDGDASRSVSPTTEGNWSDHDVRRLGVWYGFRVNHP